MSYKKKDNPAILNEFLDYLFFIKKYSINTVKEYSYDLMLFLKFLKDYMNISKNVSEFDIFVLSKVREEDILAFLVYLNYSRDDSGVTRKRKLASIKSFFKWLFANYPIGNIENPAINIQFCQIEERLPKYINLENAKKIMHIYNDNNSRYAIRNNTILSIFLNCGLRVSELSKINLNDIDLENKTIKIVGKGNKERIVYLNDYVVLQIKKYLQLRNKDIEVINLEDPLFLSSRKGRLTISAIQNICLTAYKLADLDDYGYTTHTLRHTAATIIYQYVKPDILLIKKILGHSTVMSTQIYTHISDKKIKECFDKNPLSDFEVTAA